jgi:hypothetical protein
MATKKSPSSIKATAPKKVISAKAKIAEKPIAAVRKKRAAGKSTPKLAPKLTLEPKRTTPEPEISHEAISLRAYFIAELRHKMGWPGNSQTDWTDAVAQLKAEALEKPLRKR